MRINKGNVDNNKGYIAYLILGLALLAFLLSLGFINTVNPSYNGNRYVLASPTPYGPYKSLELHTFNFISVNPTSPSSCGGGAPITLDATSKKSDDSINSITWNHTTNTSCGNVLIVGVTLSDATGRGRFDIASVTYSGINLTKLASVDGPLSSVGSYHTEMWYVPAAPVGTHSIVATLRSLAGGALPDAVAGAETFYNVNQTTPIGAAITNSGSISPASISIPSLPNQVIVDIVGGYSNGNLAVDPSQIKLWYDNVQPNQIGTTGASSDKSATGNSTVMQWNNLSSWAVIAIPINP